MNTSLLVVVVAGIAGFLLRYFVPFFLTRAGWLQQEHGVFDLAEIYFKQALGFEKVVSAITGGETGLALQYGNLGSLYKRQNRTVDAIAMYKKAVTLLAGANQEIGGVRAAPYYSFLGELFLEQKDLRSACDSLKLAIRLFERRLDTEAGRDRQDTLECIEKAKELLGKRVVG